MTRDEKLANLKPCPFCGACGRQHPSKANQYIQIVHSDRCYFTSISKQYMTIPIGQSYWMPVDLADSVPLKQYVNKVYFAWNNVPESITSITIYEAKPELWLVSIGTKEDMFIGMPKVRKVFYREAQAQAFVKQHMAEHSPEYNATHVILMSQLEVEDDQSFCNEPSVTECTG
jgi:hypothetical protein